MSYVVIDLQQRASDAKALRDYLLEAEEQLPKTVLNNMVHSWMHHVAGQIDDKAKRRVATVKAK